MSQGIAPAEIIFTEVSLDNTRLKINFDRKIPGYVAVVTMGGLPGRDINVTASAWRRTQSLLGLRIFDGSTLVGNNALRC